jgi:hypothetical protein
MPNGHDDGSYRYTFPLGFPFVLYGLLAVLAANAKYGTWFAAAALACAAAFTWVAFSRKQFEAVRAKDPSMNIETWRINWLLFFALPGYAIGLYGLV